MKESDGVQTHTRRAVLHGFLTSAHGGHPISQETESWLHPISRRNRQVTRDYLLVDVEAQSGDPFREEVNCKPQAWLASQ